MADSDDLELASEDDPMSGSANGRAGRGAHAVRKHINIKLRQSSKGRNGNTASASSATATSKKTAKMSKGTHDSSTIDRGLIEVATSSEPAFDDDVNKALEFSPVKLPGGNSSEPYHKSQKLMWNQKVNLLGEKVVDPLIHSCEKCALPILIYGRMIPCKHVFCFSCAKLTDKTCPRCNQSVSRIEQSALGTVFVCTFGGTKHGVSGCHRTYLSQRDLQSHVAHRHYGAGRDPPPQRVMPTAGTPASAAAPIPTGVVATMSFAVSQQQQQSATSSIARDSSVGMVYRSMQQQHAPPQGPSGGLTHLVMNHPPPSMSQPPPQMNQPPPQRMMSSHGSSHMMNAPPPTGPPGMLSTGSHGMPPHGMPPSGLHVQTIQQQQVAASRGTNLITVQLHEDGDFRMDTGQNSSGSGGGRMQLVTTQNDNTMGHYAPQQQQQQQYAPQGNLVQSYAVSEHHQQLASMVRPMMTHPPPLGPGQAQMGPNQTQLGPGQVMVTYSLLPNQMGQHPSGPTQRLGPPPQLQQTMPPQGMHSGPPAQQGVMSAGPPPPQGMMQTGPQGMPPPQAIHGAPPPSQGIRTGPPPQGYPGPPPHHQDQRPQYVGGQQLTWTSAPPPGGPPQMQHMGQRPSPGNIGSSQSMQYYQ